MSEYDTWARGREEVGGMKMEATMDCRCCGHDLLKGAHAEDCPRLICPFCSERRIETTVTDRLTIHGISIRVFPPLSPVVDGHLLVVPYLHVEDATKNPKVTGAVMQAASIVARRYESANILTSIGAPATQTVQHLHVHVVPRREGDGLTLPWTGQIR